MTTASSFAEMLEAWCSARQLQMHPTGCGTCRLHLILALLLCLFMGGAFPPPGLLLAPQLWPLRIAGQAGVHIHQEHHSHLRDTACHKLHQHLGGRAPVVAWLTGVCIDKRYDYQVHAKMLSWQAVGLQPPHGLASRHENWQLYVWAGRHVPCKMMHEAWTVGPIFLTSHTWWYSSLWLVAQAWV